MDAAARKQVLEEISQYLDKNQGEALKARSPKFAKPPPPKEEKAGTDSDETKLRALKAKLDAGEE